MGCCTVFHYPSGGERRLLQVGHRAKHSWASKLRALEIYSTILRSVILREWRCCNRFLESLMGPDVEYTVAVTALWAIELVYQQSFAYCLEEGSRTPPELAETCQRWGNEGFGQYCRSLQKIADRRLLRATNEELKKAQAVFFRVLEHEVEFWNMSRGWPHRVCSFLSFQRRAWPWGG